MKIYLESSIISYYTAQKSRDLRKEMRRRITRQWWQGRNLTDQFYVSEYVLLEIGRGDMDAAAKRSRFATDIFIIEPTPMVDKLAESLLDKMIIPAKSYLDAYHLAVSSVRRMDIIVTWNIKHMANPVISEKVKFIFQKHNVKLPVILTPDHLI